MSSLFSLFFWDDDYLDGLNFVFSLRLLLTEGEVHAISLIQVYKLIIISFWVRHEG
jgi:hypothetical protein